MLIHLYLYKHDDKQKTSNFISLFYIIFVVELGMILKRYPDYKLYLKVNEVWKGQSSFYFVQTIFDLNKAWEVICSRKIFD